MPDFDDLIRKEEKKHKKAIALSYDDGNDGAPRIAAKGDDFMAEQIIAIAKEHGIHIHEDADLTDVLSALEVDSFIPLEAYVAVSEILSYIYRRNKDTGLGK